MLPQHRPKFAIDTHPTNHHHDRNHQATRETPYHAERDADDVARPAPSTEEAVAYTRRTAHHLQGGRPCRPEVRRTPAMEVENAPALRGPAPHRRSCRRRCALQHADDPSHAATILLSRAPPDPSFHDSDSTTPTMDPSPEPARTLPEAGSPPNLPRQGGAYTSREALRRRRSWTGVGGGGVGWLGFCLSHPRGATWGRERLGKTTLNLVFDYLHFASYHFIT
jgi:hypothetical protein